MLQIYHQIRLLEDSVHHKECFSQSRLSITFLENWTSIQMQWEQRISSLTDRQLIIINWYLILPLKNVGTKYWKDQISPWSLTKSKSSIGIFLAPCFTLIITIYYNIVFSLIGKSVKKLLILVKGRPLVIYEYILN